MSPTQILTLCFIAALNVGIALGDSGSNLARGFNDDIDWVTFEEGQKLAKEQNKILMLLIHKSWCGACKSLKPKFATDMKLEAESKKFVMVNVMDDEEPSDKKFSPDGSYIPRILFMTPDGEVMEQQNPDGNPSYKYYYSSPDHVLKSMKQVLSKHDSGEL